LDPSRYETSAEQVKRAREQILAASLATIVFGVLLAVFKAAVVLRGIRSAVAAPAEIAGQAMLFVMGLLFVGLGLGISQKSKGCAVAAFALLVGLMGYHLWLVFRAGNPSGLMFFLLVPLVPAIAIGVSFSAMARISQAQSKSPKQ
jgi:hypothetical protein